MVLISREMHKQCSITRHEGVLFREVSSIQRVPLYTHNTLKSSVAHNTLASSTAADTVCISTTESEE